MRRARHRHGIHGASPLPSLRGCAVLPNGANPLSGQFDSPDYRSLTWAAKADFVWFGAEASCHSVLAHGRKANALGLQGNLLRRNPCSLTLLAKAAAVEYGSIAFDVNSILYGLGNLPGPFCLPGRQLRLLKDTSKPAAQPRGRFFAIMGQFSGEKL